jgi:hypothetical protein
MQKVSFIVLFSLMGFLEMHAQLKVGKDPKNVQNNSYFHLQSDINRHVVVTKDSSKLGIGTVTPNFSLEMIGLNNNDAIAIGNTVLGSSYRGKISVLGSGANDRWMKFNSDWNSTTNESRAFGFFRGENEYLTILDNGNVGIGINNPTFKLQVRGNARFTPNTLNNGTGEPVTIDIYGRSPTGTATPVGGIRMGWYNTFGGFEVLRGPSTLGVGIAFNYANTSTGATVEGMRLSFNGNLSVGTTSETNLLNLRVDSAASSSSGIDFSLKNAPNILTRINTLKNSNSNAGILTFHTNSNSGLSERMRIDSNGNVGIGINAPAWLLDVRKSSVNSEMVAQFVNPNGATTSESQLGIGGGPGAWTKIVGYNGTLGFRNYTSNLEFMTMKTGNGFIGMGTTNPLYPIHSLSNQSTNLFLENTAGDPNGVLVIKIPSTNVNCGGAITCSEMISFQNGNTWIGAITPTSNGAGTQYLTSSDQRLKENIKPSSFSIEDLMKLNVVDYNYKTDKAKSKEIGFIAQEVFQNVPSVVKIGEDKINADGLPEKPWMVDYSKLTPLVIKATQDIKRDLDAKELEIKELKELIFELKKDIEKLKQK